MTSIMDKILVLMSYTLIGLSPIFTRRCALKLSDASILGLLQLAMLVYIIVSILYYFYVKKHGGRTGIFALKYHCFLQTLNIITLFVIKDYFL